MGCGASVAVVAEPEKPEGQPPATVSVSEALTAEASAQSPKLASGGSWRRPGWSQRGRDDALPQDGPPAGETSPRELEAAKSAVVAAALSDAASSVGSDVAQYTYDEDDELDDRELDDDELGELGDLDENQKTVVHWLRNLGMLEYWPTFFEHELCDMEAVLHVTAAELRALGMKPGHQKKFMKRLMDLQTVVLTKNQEAVREWVYSLRPRRGADGSVPPPSRTLQNNEGSSKTKVPAYVSLRRQRKRSESSGENELDAIHERKHKLRPHYK